MYNKGPSTGRVPSSLRPFIDRLLHFLADPKCTYTNISLSLLSTWLSLTNEIQITVMYSRTFLVAVTSESCVKRVICKTGNGPSAWTLVKSADQDQTSQNAASDQRLYCLLRYNRKLGLNETVVSLRLGPFSHPILSQSTRQCCQCFDWM